jgi:hypothetical protein
MRRWLVLPVSAVVLLALGAWPGSAGAICPVGMRAMTPLCCGPLTKATLGDKALVDSDILPPCCPTVCCTPSCCLTACCGNAQPACPVEQLTISTSPNPSTEGKKVTISGKLTNGSTGDAVYLWQKLAGQSGFTRIAQTTTNAAGDYTLVRGAGLVNTNASWYASAVGATSPTMLQRVSAQVKIVRWQVAGTLVEVNGRVSPAHSGERISLQQYTTAMSWHAVAISVIGARSGFTVRHRFAHRGNVLLRAVFAGDARNTRSISAPLRIFAR